jgi:hypothetical protein
MDAAGLYRQIICDTLRPTMSDAEVLAVMVVLHTHAVVLRPGAAGNDLLADDDGRVTLQGLTRHHVADLTAACFPAGSHRADHDYWHTAYGFETPYEVLEDVPPELLDAVLAAREALTHHAWVDRLIPD